MNSDLNVKMRRLNHLLKGYRSIAVAFSGGVDSTFLLFAAAEVLGENVLAVTAASIIHPRGDGEEAKAFAAQRGIRHVVFDSGEMNLPEFVENRKSRCYICKKNLFSEILDMAREAGLRHVAHGANVDDLDDFRPGFRAADEMKIRAPLIEAGLTKAEIRILSKNAGLAAWNKPAMACLASRVPYGMPIDGDVIRMISRAEDVVAGLGIRFCRVRHHGEVARIEISPDAFEKLLTPSAREHLLKELRGLGYSHVALDIEGYVQGSMNR